MAKSPLVFELATPTLCKAATLLVSLYGPMGTYFCCLPDPNSVRGFAMARSSNLRRHVARDISKFNQTYIVTDLLITDRYIWYQNDRDVIPHTSKATKLTCFCYFSHNSPFCQKKCRNRTSFKFSSHGIIANYSPGG